jgi:hypothetical protein
VLEPEGDILRFQPSHGDAHRKVFAVLLLRFHLVTEGREQIGGGGRRGALVADDERATPDNGLHEGRCFLAGRGKVSPAERRLPGPFDGGKERFLVTNARGTSYSCIETVWKKWASGRLGFLPGGALRSRR